jgi:uncharacterized protein YybS (DUF2232 family)
MNFLVIIVTIILGLSTFLVTAFIFEDHPWYIRYFMYFFVLAMAGFVLINSGN